MSLMLDPEEVDDGYFTPVASTTLASIFQDDSNNDAAVNPSLKYRPAQPKKPAQSRKPDDHNASECVFSCSIIAYEWIQGTHKCKGKVGFAMMRIVKTGLCKIILYSSDKSTLSCTTIVPQLQVTLKGAMISLYDDHKKYWGLCFTEKVIEQVKELLKAENVIMKNYVIPDFKPETENLDSDEATEETDSSSMLDYNTPTSRNDKASILNRIANVGHAILPSLPGSPVKKTTSTDIISTPEICESTDKLILPDVNSDKTSSNYTKTLDQDGIKTSATQITENNAEKSSMLINNIKPNALTVTSVPLVNNQIFTYVNGFMVPLHMQVPVISDEFIDTTADFDLIIQKLNHLKGVVKTMEMTKKFQNNEEKIHACTCKSRELQHATTIKKLSDKNEMQLKRISELEQLITDKDDNILKLQNKVQNEIKKNSDIIKEHHHYQRIIEKSNQELNKKTEDLKQMISKKEADLNLANTVKTLMNDTFRSLASNFDNDVNYEGNNVKAVLAAVIKKNTVESLSSLFSKPETSNTTTKTSE